MSTTRRLIKILKVHLGGKSVYLPHEQTTTGRERNATPAEKKKKKKTRVKRGSRRGDAGLFNDSAACRWRLVRQVGARCRPQGVTLCSHDTLTFMTATRNETQEQKLKSWCHQFIPVFLGGFFCSFSFLQRWKITHFYLLNTLLFEYLRHTFSRQMLYFLIHCTYFTAMLVSYFAD